MTSGCSLIIHVYGGAHPGCHHRPEEVCPASTGPGYWKRCILAEAAAGVAWLTLLRQSGIPLVVASLYTYFDRTGRAGKAVASTCCES